MRVEDRRAQEQFNQLCERIRSCVNINWNETKLAQALRIRKAKRNYGYMVKTYFPHYADADCANFQINLANRAKRKKTIRELVRWGRGLAKSVHCDIFIPIWLWMNGENVYAVLVGNSYDKAKKLLGDVQAEFESNDLLIHDFGDQKCAGAWSDGDFRTKDGRFIGKALGMGQSPRGLRQGKLRPNLIICDDLEDKDTSRNPKRQDEVVDWIERDLLPTMDGDTRRYFHPNNDPWVRSIQNLLEARHPSWHLDEVQAYDPVTHKPAWYQKYSDTYYKDVEDDLGRLAAMAEYNHHKHKEGKIFTDEMIQYAKLPRINSYTVLLGFWDVAFSGKNDYNAIPVLGLRGRNFHCEKFFCRQCKMVEAIRFMYKYEKTLPPGVVVHWHVEEQFWNDPMRDALKVVEAEYGYPLALRIVKRPRLNKYDRIVNGLMPYFQNGRTYFNIDEKYNNDMMEAINQLKGIEPGYKSHDDAPDALEQAHNEAAAFIKSTAFEPMLTSISELRSSNSHNSY